MSGRGAIVGTALIMGGLFIGAAFNGHRAQAAQDSKEAKEAKGPAHYTVVETQGFNLLVTDNDTNRLYFYTVDKNEDVGATLKLRANVDLNQVGQQTIKPTRAASPGNM